MALIKSISGIRGTIGGTPGENLTPVDIVKFTAAYGSIITKGSNARIVVGRDGRIKLYVAGAIDWAGDDVAARLLAASPRRR